MSTAEDLLLEPPETPRLETWRCAMRQRYKDRVEIRFTNNRRSMVSIRRGPRGRVKVRLQKGFEHAPRSILRDLEDVIAGNRVGAWKRVCAFARELPAPGLSFAREAKAPLRTLGKVHDLQALLDDVNAAFFQGNLQTRITWGTEKPSKPGRRRSRTVQFGVWDEARDLIRIHPKLDDKRVPREFMRYLVYHELCHAVCPPRRGPGGQRLIHHPEFKTLEARFPGLAQMERMSKTVFERIVRERGR